MQEWGCGKVYLTRTYEELKGDCVAVEKAEVGRRFFAVLVDGFVAGLLGMVPLIGGLLSTAYMLTRDAIWHTFMTSGDWQGRSVGKRLMGLRVVRLDGGPVDLATSAKRNITLVAGSILIMVPVLGKFVGPLVALGFAALELFLVVTDPQGRRFGDRWADTVVIQAD